MDNSWEKLDDCLKALTPCRVLSKVLQKEQLTFGDFYLSWMNCVLEIDKLNTAFAFFLTRCMKERETALMNNDCFISAIYLVPRVNSILTNEQLEKARDHLVQTYQRAVRLISTNNVNSTAPEESEVPDEELSSSRSTITELDAFLRAQFRRRQQNMLNFNSEHNFKRILNF
ncbi:unnamed protein product [Euphydryas editha]|uniref:Uncharacterized protein n=1 Tax=Euphydryas editha TaxID=104508 RepID=A0AAU9TT83_EUPED|nr:unnamed protein product [Euphydryas editha]